MQFFSFLKQFKRHFCLFLSVLFCTLVLTFSFFNWTSFRLSHHFNSQKQQIVLRCPHQNQPCLKTNTAVWEDEGVLQTMLWMAKPNNHYQIEELFHHQTTNGVLITPDRNLTSTDWKNFQTIYQTLNQKTPLFHQTVIPKLQSIANSTWHGFSWIALLSLFAGLSFFIFFGWQLWRFGSGWGSFNFLFNVSMTVFMLFICQTMEIILNPFNLTVLSLAWITFTFCQTKMMTASLQFRPQKAFLQLWKRNYLFWKQTGQFLLLFALVVLPYFLINFPAYNQKLFLTSFDIFLPRNNLFAVSKLSLLALLVFGLGLKLLYQFFLFLFFHLFHKDFYSWNPFQPRHRDKVKPANWFSLSAPRFFNQYRALVVFGLLTGLALICFLLIPLLFAVMLPASSLLAVKQTAFASASVRSWLFFQKWQVLLTSLGFILLLLFSYHWFLWGWRLSLLWIGKMVIGISFAILVPFAIALAFPALRLNNFFLFFAVCLFLFKLVQSFLFFQQLHYPASNFFPSISASTLWWKALLSLLPLLFWFGIDWKHSLFFLLVLHFNQLVQWFEQQFCLWGWNRFQRWKEVNLAEYQAYKIQPFLEKEIVKIND